MFIACTKPKYGAPCAMLMVYEAYEAINMLLQIEQSKIREITHK
jgi:hypothetical protein